MFKWFKRSNSVYSSASICTLVFHKVKSTVSFFSYQQGCIVLQRENRGSFGWASRPSHTLLSLLKGLTACLATEGLLGCVNHVQKAIFISLLFVDLRNGSGHTDHAVLIHKKEKGLGGVELQSTPTKNPVIIKLLYWHKHDETICRV